MSKPCECQRSPCFDRIPIDGCEIKRSRTLSNMAQPHCVKYVVVDSAGFIRNAPLKDLAEHVYTISEVVSEIRDKATRQRLQVLPYELKFRQPSTEAIRTVTDFSKKTGDYRVLSAVDIKLMALAYQLEKEYVGTEHIRLVPAKQATWNSSTKHLEKPTEIAGFYLGKKKSDSTDTSRTTSVSETSETEILASHIAEVQISSAVTENEHRQETPDCRDESQVEIEKTSNTEENVVEIEVVDKSETQDAESSIKDRNLIGDGDLIPSDCILENDSEDEADEEDDEDDDDDGWITPGNISAVKERMGGDDKEQTEVTVGCMTTDFAMQNVLIQMGLNVVSIDGMLIRRAKSYAMRCFGCMKVTTRMESDFCPHCGNKTLQRVSMSVDEEGKVQYFMSRRKPVTTRGMRFSLPMPTGGKHSSNPILCADQKRPGDRMAKQSRIKYNALDENYTAHTSPFAPIDVHSRSAQLGVRDFEHNFKKRRNPNENKKVYGRRK